MLDRCSVSVYSWTINADNAETKDENRRVRSFYQMSRCLLYIFVSSIARMEPGQTEKKLYGLVLTRPNEERPLRLLTNDKVP